MKTRSLLILQNYDKISFHLEKLGAGQEVTSRIVTYSVSFEIGVKKGSELRPFLIVEYMSDLLRNLIEIASNRTSPDGSTIHSIPIVIIYMKILVSNIYTDLL